MDHCLAAAPAGCGRVTFSKLCRGLLLFENEVMFIQVKKKNLSSTKGV